MSEGQGRETGRIFEWAPAKVNLWLQVTGRRDDGYHFLESLVAFAGIGDSLELERADRFSLHVRGPFADRLRAGDDNLVMRAALGLAKIFPNRIHPARMSLTKTLPVSSGLGGGSADAAATLRGLCALSGFTADRERLFALARRLGADVPACLAGHAALISGIGDCLSPVDLPPNGVVLVNPGVKLSTREVFDRFDHAGGVETADCRPACSGGNWRNINQLSQVLACRGNDLERPARAVLPEIDRVLAVLDACPGVLLARMSGSGATCFALLSSLDEAHGAARMIKADHPDWWVVATQLA
ncbi:MAG: 4-(cytidine 5'-diphospho)-2-C-methyl-D-erythritol kinase [Hyphomicrobiales bacterium]